MTPKKQLYFLEIVRKITFISQNTVMEMQRLTLTLALTLNS